MHHTLFPTSCWIKTRFEIRESHSYGKAKHKSFVMCDLERLEALRGGYGQIFSKGA